MKTVVSVAVQGLDRFRTPGQGRTLVLRRGHGADRGQGLPDHSHRHQRAPGPDPYQGQGQGPDLQLFVPAPPQNVRSD